MKGEYITCGDILKSMVSTTEADKLLIHKACKFAKEKHNDQKRYSGDPYYYHVFHVAKILAELRMSSSVVAAGVLHDTLEDTETTIEELEEEFNKEIAFLVDAVSHLGEVRYRGLYVRIKSLQKLFISTSKDINVIIIKLSDRLHNMRTLQYVPKEKVQRICKETLNVYIPIAHRLSIGKVAAELEELVFKYLEPSKYKELNALIKKRVKNFDLTKIEDDFSKILTSQGVINFTISTRIKSASSTEKKMRTKKYGFDEVQDIIATRIIVDDIPTAYTVLGIIHSNWRSIPQKFKDYISFPKPNGYRSIQTRIFFKKQIIEVQLRTYEMDMYAKFGHAAHHNYKDKNEKKKNINIGSINSLIADTENSKDEDWFKKVLGLESSEQHEKEFMKTMESDFLKQRMFIFTPKGDVIDLPIGATALDFAFLIHTGIGQKAEGALINKKYKALSTELKNGDIVEIKKSKKVSVNPKWLDIVKTSEAKSKINNFIRKNS